MSPFTDFYGLVKPALGEKPLLVILLEPRDVRVRDVLDIYALKDDGYVGHLALSVSEADSEKPVKTPVSGERADPLPQTRLFQESPALLFSPDHMLLNVFALGQDGYVYQSRHNRESDVEEWRNWTPWSALPQTMKFKSGPAALNSPDGDLASVYALGQDDYLYQIVYSRMSGGGWQTWTRIPGTQRFKSAPAVMNSPDGNLASIFALGDDDCIYQMIYSRKPGGGWQTWTRIPGAPRFKSAPAVMNSPDGELASVFALGQDDAIHQIIYSRKPGGGWQAWTQIPGTQRFKSAPAAMNSPDGELAHLLALGQDNTIYRTVYPRIPGGAWQAWSQVPVTQPFASAPAVLPQLLHRRSQKLLQSMFFGVSNSVRGYFLENSYGKFTFKEACTTPWLIAVDDPVTSDYDEASHKFVYAAGDAIEVRKSGWVIEQVEKLTSFKFTNWDKVATALGGVQLPYPLPLPDGKVTQEDISIFWVYAGESDARERGIPAIKVPRLSIDVDIGTLVRGASYMALGTMAHELAHEALYLDDLYDAMHIAGIDIAGSDDHVHVWFDDGSTCSGTSTRLDHYQSRENCALPSGKETGDIIGVAIAKSDDHVYVWYKDLTVSAGTYTDLGCYRTPQAFTLAPGRSAADVVDIAIDRNDHVHVWYTDRTVSSGDSKDLDADGPPQPYLIPGGKSPLDILAIGIAGSNDRVYVWYNDGTVTSGTTTDLDAYYVPHPYMLPPEAYPGPGRVSLMDSEANGSHLDPWSKMKLGWLTPNVVTHSGLYPLRAVETYPEAYILHDPAHGADEYFVVENRWPGGSYEAGFPSGGLAVWHIHERQPVWASPGHMIPNWGRKTIHLLKARGPYADDTLSLMDGADPLRRYDLTPDSSPTNTRWDDGTSSRISIKGISAAGPRMTAYFEVP